MCLFKTHITRITYYPPIYIGWLIRVCTSVNTRINMGDTGYSINLKIMLWLPTQVSFYNPCTDAVGRPATLRDILMCHGIEPIHLTNRLRSLDPYMPNYKTLSSEIKRMLPMFSPSALLRSRRNDPSQVIHYSGLMQLDFDSKDIYEYDLEELKQCVFSMPFVAYCGLSCSGRGFYALVAIAEPERQREYAEHLFHVFAEYGIKPDTSKGRNVNDCRFVSYDKNFLLREDPEPLKIKIFRKPQQKTASNYTPYKPYAGPAYRSNSGLINSLAIQIRQVQCGQRWETVQRVAYTLGGIGDPAALDAIIQAIYSNPQFQGQEAKYIKCAQDCFYAGTQRPLIR